MPPESLPHGRSAKRVEPGGFQKLVDARVPLGRALPEQPAEEVDVVENAERRIEIAAKPLRHVGDAAVTRPAMVLVRHVSVEHHDFAGLNLAHPGDEGEQSGLADAVGPDQSRHALGGNIEGEVVERERLSVAVRYALDPGDVALLIAGSFTASSAGQGIFGSVRTNPSPRTPVFTWRWYLLSTWGSAWSLTRNISFSRSSAVSTLFGVNWASVATKLMVAGRTYCGIGSRIVRASSPSVSCARHIRGQIDRHVDVVEIENGQYALSCGNHLTGASKPVLHASSSWGDEHQIDENRLQPLDIGFGGLDCGLGLVALGICRNVAGLRRFELVAPLIDDLLRYIPVLHQRLSAFIIWSGKIQIALALGDERVRFR